MSQCSRSRWINKKLEEIFEMKSNRNRTKTTQGLNERGLYFNTSYILFLSQAIRICFNHKKNIKDKGKEEPGVIYSENKKIPS